MGFCPLFPSPPKEREVSYKANEDNQGILVEFLTPLRGQKTGELKRLEVFQVHAQQVGFLDYIMEDCQETDILGSTGYAHVTVPNSARFAFHKLIVAGRRLERERAKIRKDVAQSRQLFGHLMETDPEGLVTAREALRNARWLKHVQKGIRLMGIDDQLLADQIRKDFDV